MQRDLINDLVKAQAVDVHHSVQALHLCFWQLVLAAQCLYTQCSKYAALLWCRYEVSLGCAEAACPCKVSCLRLGDNVFNKIMINVYYVGPEQVVQDHDVQTQDCLSLVVSR